MRWTGTVLQIVGDGSGLTAIDGGNIQTDRDRAKLNVVDLAAVSANVGVVNVNQAMTLNVATGALIGQVAGVEQWRLDQYGLELQALADPQNIIFASATHQQLGRLETVDTGTGTYLTLDVQPRTATYNTQLQIGAEAQDAGANVLFAKFTASAPYNADGNLAASIMQVGNAVAEFLITANTVAVPADYRGVALVARAETSTTSSVEMGRLEFQWVTVAHASRAPRVALKLTNYVGATTIFNADAQLLDLPTVGFALGGDYIQLFQDGHALFVRRCGDQRQWWSIRLRRGDFDTIVEKTAAAG